MLLELHLQVHSGSPYQILMGWGVKIFEQKPDAQKALKTCSLMDSLLNCIKKQCILRAFIVTVSFFFNLTNRAARVVLTTCKQFRGVALRFGVMEQGEKIRDA